MARHCVFGQAVFTGSVGRKQWGATHKAFLGVLCSVFRMRLAPVSIKTIHEATRQIGLRAAADEGAAYFVRLDVHPLHLGSVDVGEEVSESAIEGSKIDAILLQSRGSNSGMDALLIRRFRLIIAAEACCCVGCIECCLQLGRAHLEFTFQLSDEVEVDLGRLQTLHDDEK